MTVEARVIRSQIECKACGEVIASFYRHDFNYCKCKKVAIDGGLDYLRILGGDWAFRSIVVDDGTSTDDCKLILGVLCAMPFKECVTLEVIGNSLHDQHQEKPWFPDPSAHDLSRALAVLVERGYVEVDPECPEGRYLRTAPLAPWRG